MTTPLYRVVDWEANYENNRTKELKHLTWIRMPTKHDGDGYTQLLDHPNAAAHFGAWVAMVEVAGKCDPRGTLVRESGRPHTAESLSRMTRIPAVVFEEVIPRLVSIDIGWLEVVGCAALTEGQQAIPHEGAVIPHVTPTLSREIREEESRVDKKRKKDSLSNVTDDTLQSVTMRDCNVTERDSKRFKPPTPAEVTAYAKTIDFDLDGENFCNFYESKGWKVGNTPMKKWQAAVCTWKKRDTTPPAGQAVAAARRKQRDAAIIDDYVKEVRRTQQHGNAESMAALKDKIRDAITPSGLARVEQLVRTNKERQ